MEMRADRAGLRRLVALGLLTLGAGALFCCQRRSTLVHRAYRIGFEQNPPYHFRNSDGTLSGIAYEIVSEAAQREGIKLEWVERPESSEAALRNGQVDLWPLVTDLPERHQWLYISRPFLQTDHFLVVREGNPV